jgi:hypothetical protein
VAGRVNIPPPLPPPVAVTVVNPGALNDEGLPLFVGSPNGEPVPPAPTVIVYGIPGVLNVVP